MSVPQCLDLFRRAQLGMVRKMGAVAGGSDIRVRPAASPRGTDNGRPPAATA